MKYIDVGEMRVVTNDKHIAEQIKSDSTSGPSQSPRRWFSRFLWGNGPQSEKVWPSPREKWEPPNSAGNNHIQKWHFAPKKTHTFEGAPPAFSRPKCSFFSDLSFRHPFFEFFPLFFLFFPFCSFFHFFSFFWAASLVLSQGYNEHYAKALWPEKTTHSSAAPQYSLGQSVHS